MIHEKEFLEIAKDVLDDSFKSSWPPIWPKKWNYKKRRYIHYAAYQQDAKMLDIATKQKHDFKKITKSGLNALECIFNPQDGHIPENIYVKRFRLIDKNFLERMFILCPKMDLIHLFNYFIGLTSCEKIHFNLLCSQDQFQQLKQNYHDCYQLLKNQPWTSQDLTNLWFNNHLQLFILEDACPHITDKNEDFYLNVIVCLTMAIYQVHFLHDSPLVRPKFKPLQMIAPNIQSQYYPTLFYQPIYVESAENENIKQKIVSFWQNITRNDSYVETEKIKSH